MQLTSPTLRYLKLSNLPIVLHQELPYFSVKTHFFYFHLMRLLFFQLTMAWHLLSLNLDPSIDIAKPAWSFLAFFKTDFLQSIIISPGKLISDLMISIGSTPLAKSIEWLTVICQANNCPYKIGRTFWVHIGLFSSSFWGWSILILTLKLIGKNLLVMCLSGNGTK